MWGDNEKDFSVLKGQTFIKVEGMEQWNDEVTFTTNKGKVYQLMHQQD